MSSWTRTARLRHHLLRVGIIRGRFIIAIRRVSAVPIMAAEDVTELILRVRPQRPVLPHVRPLPVAEGIVVAVVRVAEAVVVAVVAADERLTVFGEEV